MFVVLIAPLFGRMRRISSSAITPLMSSLRGAMGFSFKYGKMPHNGTDTGNSKATLRWLCVCAAWSEDGFDGVGEALHVVFAFHAGDVDAAFADHVHGVVVAQALNPFFAERQQGEHAAV